MRYVLALLLSLVVAWTTPPVQAAPETPMYAAYLKDPASLGFKPDQALFQSVLSQVRQRHFDAVSDEKLFAGVAKETRRLLHEARLSANALDRFAVDGSLAQHVATAYSSRVDSRLLYYAMIRGLLEGTGDPYTVLMTPEEYKQLEETVQSRTFSGVGLFIDLDHENRDKLTIVEPVEGTPASEAGLLPGDQIVQIDGTPTDGMSLDVATSRIRGSVGSQVVLAVQRSGTPGVKTFPLTRADIRVSSVTHRMLPAQVGYIKLRVFGADTGSEIDRAVASLQADGAKSLIVDLRNNGGGYLTAASDVCSHFVPSGAVVTIVTDKAGASEEYKAAAPHAHTSLPMVLLVNGYSASASEITAGCLKDYGRAVLVGSRTFGKGSVQQISELPGGAALKVTIAHFFTPKGGKINKVGVTPDVEVPMKPGLVGRGDQDVQMQAALEYLRTHS